MPHAQALRDTALVIPPSVLHAKKRRLAIGVLVLAIGLLGAAGYAWWALRSAESAAVYRTARAERRDIVQSVEATGHLDVIGRVEVPAPAAGQLITIAVDAGQTVERGQVLARLDEEAARFAVQTARARLSAAQSRVSEARAALDFAANRRQLTEELASKVRVSKSRLAQVRTDEAKAIAALQAARAERNLEGDNLALAEQQRKRLTIEAPVGGIVLRVPESSGSAVAPERGALFIIGTTLDVMRLDVLVAEADIGEIHVGQRAEFTVPAYPGRTFIGKVDDKQIEPERDGNAVRYRVSLRVDNADHALLPGMTGDARIAVASVEQALAVPEAALRFSPPEAPPAPPRSRVYVSPDGIREAPVSVVAGVSDGRITQVTPAPGEHLAPGDPVIVGLSASARERASEGAPGITLGGRRP